MNLTNKNWFALCLLLVCALGVAASGCKPPKKATPKAKVKTKGEGEGEGAKKPAAKELGLDELIKNVPSEDKKTSLHAIDELGKMGDSAEAAVPALQKALASEDTEVQWHAARALGSIGSGASSVAPDLVKALDSDDPQVRAYAAFALGRIGDKSSEAVDKLVKTAFDKSVLVRRASLGALQAIDPPQEKVLPVVTKILEEGDLSIVMPAMHSLAEGGKSVVPRLCDALKDEKACYWACLVLAEIGPDAEEAVPNLKEVLKHKDPEVRLEAVVALGEIGAASKPVSPDIVALLKEDELGVQCAAAFALGKIGTDDEATEALNGALESEDAFLRMISAWALARNNPEDEATVQRAVKLMIEGFKSDNVHLRRAAAKAAVDFDVSPDTVAPMLVESLGDKDPVVVENAVDALAELGPKALKHTDKLLKHEDLRHYAVLLIFRLGAEAEPAVPAMIAALAEKPQSDDDTKFQRELQLALGAIGPGAKDAVETLAKSLDSENEEICASASYALGKIGPEARGAVPALRKNLKKESQLVQLASVRALLEIQPGETQLGPVAIPLLTKGLENEHEFLRAECATALGEIGSPAEAALPQLKALAEDKSELVRQAAAEAIKKIEK